MGAARNLGKGEGARAREELGEEVENGGEGEVGKRTDKGLREANGGAAATIAAAAARDRAAVDAGAGQEEMVASVTGAAAARDRAMSATAAMAGKAAVGLLPRLSLSGQLRESSLLSFFKGRLGFVGVGGGSLPLL